MGESGASALELRSGGRALVLFDWLARLNKNNNTDLTDQAGNDLLGHRKLSGISIGSSVLGMHVVAGRGAEPSQYPAP